MKKTIIIAIAILTLAATICIFAACGNINTDIATTPNTSTDTNVAYIPEPFHMEEADLFELYLKLYSEKSEDENFISDEEELVYNEFGFNIRNYEDGYVVLYSEAYNESTNFYYPVVITDPKVDEVVIAYITENGSLATFNATQNRTEYYRNIHVPEGIEYIDYKTNFTVVHSNEFVELWEFGKKTAEAKIPTESVYAGKSEWEGYIFRNGGDVYSVQVKQDESANPKITCDPIAHGVKEVIVSDYKLNSDAWSQPLFLMEDGSIKAYCDWHGDKDAPRDDACHLAPPQYEGGYK